MKACDVKSVPLLDKAIDIAVFSLSLMGKNWPDYIKEAKMSGNERIFTDCRND